jgi:hypothetical protein
VRAMRARAPIGERTQKAAAGLTSGLPRVVEGYVLTAHERHAERPPTGAALLHGLCSEHGQLDLIRQAG